MSVKKISAYEAAEMMESGDVVVLDVRMQEERDRGYIAGSSLLPLQELTEKSAAEVVSTKDTAVLVYCEAGVRSAMAAEKLDAMGYENVYDFGGIADWPFEIVR